jgi:small conductance mechanosensitive channel
MEINFLYKKLDELKSQTINFIPTILSSIFIFIIFYVIAGYFRKFVISDIMNVNQEKNKINIVYNELLIMVYYSIIIFGLIFGLVNLGFNIPTIITILGTIGLALGLAFQNTFQNIIASLFISMNDLYSLGDVIVLRVLSNFHNITGTVVNFNLYTTTLVDSKTNLLTTIPNSAISNNIIINVSRSQ